MAEESKSSLRKVLEEMLARAKLYQQSPQAQVNAQMSAKDPNFAAGAVVGQLLGDYIGRQLRNRQKEQSVNDADQAGGGANPPTTLGEEPAATQTINPFGRQAGQGMMNPNISLLGNGNSALQQAADQQSTIPTYDNAFGAGSPNAWRDILARLRGGI